MSKLYEDTLESMKKEFFSQAEADMKRTQDLQMEFEQNVRSFRNIAGSLYRYRWQFIPKDPPVSQLMLIIYL